VAHIKIVEPDQAGGEASKLFDTAQAAFGLIPEPLKLFAHNPKVANAVFDGFGPSMSQPSLSQPFFAWIRYLLAYHTDCTHCVDVNAGMLLDIGVSQDALTEAVKDKRTVPLPEKEKALLLACLKVVGDHKALSKEEIDDLKKLGHSDADLVAAFHHSAHTQATDLMINAFGL
jgi:alkylhydroperoxidase family enzyme